MTIANNEDRRNPDGLAGSRRRYIRRAVTVAASPEFRQDVDELRLKWNRDAPRYRVIPVPSVTTLLQSDTLKQGYPSFEPPRLREDTPNAGSGQVSLVDWMQLQAGICRQYWPVKYFPLVPPMIHPAMLFVSACFFCSSYEVGEIAERFFPEFSIGPHSMPYEPRPDDRYRIAELTGQVNFLLGVMRTQFGDSWTDARTVESKVAGGQYAQEEGVRRWWSDDPSDDWWYIPLPPGLSTTDFRNAAGMIVEFMRGIHGDRRLDDMVFELRDERLSQQKIADLLGISKDMVADALNSRSRSEKA